MNHHGMGPAEATTARRGYKLFVRSGRAMLPQSPQHVGTRTSSGFTFMKDGLTEAEAGKWIDTGNERWPMGHPRFAVVDAHDDHRLGQVGLNFNPRHVSAEAHYWVVASERGRGVASRALSLLIDWGFSKGIERVFLVIHPENEASNRLAATLGFHTRRGAAVL